MAALASHAGSQTRAAAFLGMSRRTFVTKLERYGIPRPQKGQRDEELDMTNVARSGVARPAGAPDETPAQ